MLHVQERVKQIIEDREASHGDLINEGHLINSIATAMGIERLCDRGLRGHQPGLRQVPGVRHHPALRALPPGEEPLQRGHRRLGLDPGHQDRAQAAELRAGPQGPHPGLAQAGDRPGAYLRGATTPRSSGPSPPRTRRPGWGVWVSGRKRPYLYPGWIESLEFITGRLEEGGQRAADRINGGESTMAIFTWPHAFLPHALCDFLRDVTLAGARVTTAVPRQRVYPLLVVQHAGLGRLGTDAEIQADELRLQIDSWAERRDTAAALGRPGLSSPGRPLHRGARRHGPSHRGRGAGRATSTRPRSSASPARAAATCTSTSSPRSTG